METCQVKSRQIADNTNCRTFDHRIEVLHTGEVVLGRWALATDDEVPGFIREISFIPGVVDVLVRRYSLWVSKGSCFDWSKIEPRIVELIKSEQDTEGAAVSTLLIEGRRVKLKSQAPCEDFPEGLPEEFGELLSTDDPCVVCVDDIHRDEGDDGLREVGLDQVELVRFRCKNCEEEFSDHSGEAYGYVPGTDDVVTFVECCLRGELT